MKRNYPLAPTEKAHWLTRTIYAEWMSRGLSVSAACRRAGVERRQWHRWRHGQQPKLEHVERILKALGMRLRIDIL